MNILIDDMPFVLYLIWLKLGHSYEKASLILFLLSLLSTSLPLDYQVSPLGLLLGICPSHYLPSWLHFKPLPSPSSPNWCPFPCSWSSLFFPKILFLKSYQNPPFSFHCLRIYLGWANKGCRRQIIVTYLNLEVYLEFKHSESLIKLKHILSEL